MRVNLQSDPAEFVKQIADLRRFLNRQEIGGTTETAIKARLMLAVLVPFCNALRTELRTDGVNPYEVFNATAELVGNIVVSAVQSLMDAPEDGQREAVERIFGAAFDVAVMTVANDGRMARDAAERARPKLAVVPKDMEVGANVVPLKQPNKGN